MPSNTPESLTAKRLRENGYFVEFVQHYNYRLHIYNDLFGFLDVLGLRKGEIIGVQCTTKPHISERVKKITNHENVQHVRDAGIKIEVWGWFKDKGRWNVSIVDCS